MQESACIKCIEQVWGKQNVENIKSMVGNNRRPHQRHQYTQYIILFEGIRLRIKGREKAKLTRSMQQKRKNNQIYTLVGGRTLKKP